MGFLMQDNELMPGRQNVVTRSTGAGAPHRRGRDRSFNPLKNLRKSGRVEVGMHLLGLLLCVRGMMMLGGEGREDPGAQLVSLWMGELERGSLFQMLVQQPGVVDQALQNQRFAAGKGRALAAHDRTVGELRARRLIGAAAEGGRRTETAVLELAARARARLEAT